jgi:very-short-patch-repair endonuclease
MERHERVVASMASGQYGLITKAQALRAGMTLDQVKWRLRSGRWQLPHDGVYLLQGSPPTRERDIMAACLAGGPGTFASHRSAAWLWGLLLPARALVEVTVPPERSGRLAGVVVHHGRGPLCAAVVLRGIPVSTPLATILELAAVEEDTEVIHRALDIGTRRRIFTGRGVFDEVLAHPRHGVPGLSRLRSVMAERGYPGIPASALERRFLHLLRKACLPAPAREVHVGPYRVDSTWDGSPFTVELDGHDTHGTPEALQADLARQNALIAAGRDLRRYTARDLAVRPAQVMEEVAQGLGLAWPQGRGSGLRGVGDERGGLRSGLRGVGDEGGGLRG